MAKQPNSAISTTSTQTFICHHNDIYGRKLNINRETLKVGFIPHCSEQIWQLNLLVERELAFILHSGSATTAQPAILCSKSTVETQEQFVKSVEI